MRAFVAVNLSASSAKPLVEAQNRIEKSAPGVYKWSNLAGIHVTLYFLGEIDESQIGRVTERLSEIKAPAFQIGWGGLVVLPSPDVPKILAAGIVGGSASLRSLQRKVHDAVFPFAENKETRAFFPHATIGRLKRGVPPSAKIVKRALADFRLPDGRQETVSTFELMLSHPGPGGSQYEVLRSFDLEPAP